MIFKPTHIASKILLFLSVLTIILSIRFIWQKENWSPIDEYAHMDYVEKLTEGRIPVLSDTISEELFLNVKNDSTRSLNPKINTREELGIGNYCYEAIHPPIYYFILTIPDLILKKCGIELFARLKVLRLITYFLFVVGMLLCIPLFSLITKLGFPIPSYYGYGCLFFGLVIATHQRYGLGNNMLSPLIINLTAIQLLRYFVTGWNKHVYWFVLFSCLSVFLAISNAALLPPLYLILLFKFKDHFSFKALLISLLMVLLSAFLFYYWKRSTIPDPAINALFQAFLNYYIPAGFLDYKTFLAFLTEDTFTLSFINKDLTLTYWMVGLFIANILTGALLIRTMLNQHKWLLAFAIFFVSLALTLFVLNKYIGGVHWVAFRHYLGFIPVVYVALTGAIPLLYSKYSKA